MAHERFYDSVGRTNRPIAAPFLARAEAPKAPAFVLGLGFGGFVDGIVLHQILITC